MLRNLTTFQFAFSGLTTLHTQRNILSLLNRSFIWFAVLCLGALKALYGALHDREC